MSVKLKNRKEIEEVLKEYLEQLVVPDALIVGICQHPVSGNIIFSVASVRYSRVFCARSYRVTLCRSTKLIWNI